MAENSALGSTINAGIDQLDGLNDKLTGLAKASATQSVDLLEKAFTGALDLQGKLVKASKLDWLAQFTEANQTIARGLAETATANARTLLK